MHIKIFGTEAWKKLSRLSIAVAGYLVSASDDYENIIVTKEHVDFAVQYFIKIYSGVPFKLDEYVEYERQYSRSDPEAVVYLQDLYIKYPAVVLHLEQNAETNKGNLGAVCGVTNDMLNGLMAELIRAKFIRMVGNTILPTERFRLTVEKIEKNTTVTRLGVS